ncbi:N-acetylglucosamine-6-phosphate deacetylase [Jannaschia rubra]|uniref:N-acetylglucosamine-6-phosphate deacetylase n=1 Tax=Jannaschia rubra TaxID=282197 RepID=UPI0024927DD8|nr:N-acetylglucosamine-6-phosphate deacetylase [Jannaschia rubra]
MPSTDAATRSYRILARRCYDGIGDALRSDTVIEVETGRIVEIRPATGQDAGDRDLVAHDLVAPGFIDLQINGAADTQFNFDPTPDALARIARGARMGGTAGILPTFITAPGRDYVRAIGAVRTAIAEGVPGILGVHLEGPFLSPDRPGIHDPDAIRALEPADLDHLIAAKAGTILLTVAPEELPNGMMARLAAAGLRVFAGHTAASADQIAHAEAEGLVGVTHLFNAMTQMTGREPGVVGAAFASRGLFVGLIADGHHVDWRNVATAIRLMPDRACLVTDAMLTLAGTATSFDLHGRRIELGDGRLTDATGRLAGAHISLTESLRNVLEHVGIGLPAALRLLTRNPGRALGLEDGTGTIAPGGPATLTCLTNGMEVAEVIIDGTRFGARDGSPLR